MEVNFKYYYYDNDNNEKFNEISVEVSENLTFYEVLKDKYDDLFEYELEFKDDIYSIDIFNLETIEKIKKDFSFYIYTKNDKQVNFIDIISETQSTNFKIYDIDDNPNLDEKSKNKLDLEKIFLSHCEQEYLTYREFEKRVLETKNIIKNQIQESESLRIHDLFFQYEIDVAKSKKNQDILMALDNLVYQKFLINIDIIFSFYLNKKASDTFFNKYTESSNLIKRLFFKICLIKIDDNKDLTLNTFALNIFFEIKGMLSSILNIPEKILRQKLYDATITYNKNHSIRDIEKQNLVCILCWLLNIEDTKYYLYENDSSYLNRFLRLKKSCNNKVQSKEDNDCTKFFNAFRRKLNEEKHSFSEPLSNLSKIQIQIIANYKDLLNFSNSLESIIENIKSDDNRLNILNQLKDIVVNNYNEYSDNILKKIIFNMQKVDTNYKNYLQNQDMLKNYEIFIKKILLKNLSEAKFEIENIDEQINNKLSSLSISDKDEIKNEILRKTKDDIDKKINNYFLALECLLCENYPEDDISKHIINIKYREKISEFNKQYPAFFKEFSEIIEFELIQFYPEYYSIYEKDGKININYMKFFIKDIKRTLFDFFIVINIISAKEFNMNVEANECLYLFLNKDDITEVPCKKGKKLKFAYTQ